MSPKFNPCPRTGPRPVSLLLLSPCLSNQTASCDSRKMAKALTVGRAKHARTLYQSKPGSLVQITLPFKAQRAAIQPPQVLQSLVFALSNKCCILNSPKFKVDAPKSTRITPLKGTFCEWGIWWFVETMWTWSSFQKRRVSL